MSRLKLHAKICEIIGSKNVYFQPPESFKIEYPCVIYSLSSVSPFHANNTKYSTFDEYQIIYITKDPDTAIRNKILNYLRYCRFDRYYSSDNLHHFVFTLYDDYT